MKRILLLFTLLLTLAGASYAQVYYRCTGQNVRVRTAPSLKSGIVQYSGAYGSEGPVMLNKGEIVCSLGVQRNGFAKVAHVSSYNLWDEGWVSLQYLVRAQRCSNCGGKGYFNQRCPECNGDGAHWCCDFTGKKQCSQCHGIGYK
jgi:hypothetical protein